MLRDRGSRAYDRLWRSGLLNVGSIARRELGAYWVSPIGYVVAAVLIPIASYLGYDFPLALQQPVAMDGVFNMIFFLSVIWVPAYTMRLFAEERRSGTLEMLLTSPVRDWELVVGKWLGAFVFFLATLLFTLVIAVLLIHFQPATTRIQPLGLSLEVGAIDYGMLVSGYLGLVLLGAAAVAIGALASSLTQNQIIAFFMGAGPLIALFYLFGNLSGSLQAPYSDFFGYLSAFNHYTPFNQGRVVLQDVVYFVTLTAGALFLATRVLESRKWR